MPFQLVPPPEFTDYNSYPYKRWVNSVYNIITGLTTLTTVATTYTVAANLFYIRGDATSGIFTITLPPALGNEGRPLLLKKIDSSGNAITIAAAGSDTIEGSATKSLAAQWDKYHLISNGVNTWEIM